MINNKKIVNIGDSKKQEFMLVIEPNMNLPAWITMKDELWIRIVGNSLYEWLSRNKNQFPNQNLLDNKTFAAEVPMVMFKNALFTSPDAILFRDTVLNLRDQINETNALVDRTYVSYFSDSPTNEHVLSVMFETGLAKIFINLGDDLKIDDPLHEIVR